MCKTGFKSGLQRLLKPLQHVGTHLPSECTGQKKGNYMNLWNREVNNQTVDDWLLMLASGLGPSVWHKERRKKDPRVYSVCVHLQP